MLSSSQAAADLEADQLPVLCQAAVGEASPCQISWSQPCCMAWHVMSSSFFQTRLYLLAMHKLSPAPPCSLQGPRWQSMQNVWFD